MPAVSGLPLSLPRTTLVAIAVAGLAAAGGCVSGAPPAQTTQGTPAVVHVPTSSDPPTTDPAGLLIVSLPTALPSVALSDDRVRGQDYAYSVPRDWTEVHPQADPQPDSMIAPSDPQLPYYIAVDRVFGVGARSLDEVVTQLRSGFSGTGILKAAPQRQVAGFPAAGVVVDDPPRTRHVYAISLYAQRVFPIRVTYHPDHERDALAALDAVLASWTWG